MIDISWVFIYLIAVVVSIVSNIIMIILVSLGKILWRIN
jgi:hypothetical protein